MYYYNIVIQLLYFSKGSFPAYLALSPKYSSIRNNWLYLQVLSLRQGAPVFIYLAFNPTTRSAIKWSSVSPLLWDTITFQLLF